MHRARIYAMVGTALSCILLTQSAAADSQVRIVRLSDVHGTVQIDKNSGLGFENAFANLPVVQGTELRTRENGRAEIEFEDGSTLRVTPNTTVRFSTLALSDAGKRISAVELVGGKAYVNWLGKTSDELTLSFSQERLELRQAAHFRVASSQGTAEIASLKNQLIVEGPSGITKVEKKKTVTFDVNDSDRPTAAKNSAEDPYDQWDQQAIDYHAQYSKNNSTPYGYGFSDLNYYGGHNNVAGRRTFLAAPLRRGGMESVYGWRVVVVSRLRIYVGIRISLGLDALLLWQLDVCTKFWLGLATRWLEYVARWNSLWRGCRSVLLSSGCPRRHH